jgi:RNA recognition motif-containing protein
LLTLSQLPWSTSDEDLVELFQTIGKVERAEIKREPNGRSSGAGVVQFPDTDLAQQAISKFSGYMYGGRALNIRYNRYSNQAADMDGQDATMQEQVM